MIQTSFGTPSDFGAERTKRSGDALTALSCGVVYLKMFDDLNGPSFWANQCTPALIGNFHQRGINVIGWGYHFDGKSVVDPKTSAAEVTKGIACGLDGYIVDLEKEVENIATHPYVDELLVALRAVMNGKMLGYTSFGHPGYHPNIPWTILDQRCDAAFPQIYFDDWNFGSSVEAMVQSALKAYQDLGLKHQIFPVWGSEASAPYPASAETLQSYLNRFPESSIYRTPNVNEAGQAWRLDYKGGSGMLAYQSSNERDLL